jgi:tetratricopeptide (TPR) repeat protein
MTTRPKLKIILALLAPACERFYRGPGFVVHDAKEAVGFALVSLDREDHVGAEKMANVALEIDPKHANAFSVLGTVQMRKKNYPEAIKYFEKALENSDESRKPVELTNLGYAQFCNSEYQSSRTSFREANDKGKSWATSFGLAIAAFNLGFIDEAQDYLKTFLTEAEPESKIKSLLDYFRITLNAPTRKFVGLKI